MFNYYNVNIIKFVVYEIFIKNKFCFRSGSWVGEDFEIVDKKLRKDETVIFLKGSEVIIFTQWLVFTLNQ